MTEYSLGPFKRVLLIGGGRLLFRLAVWAKGSGFQINVITAPRHASELIDEIGSNSLLNALEDANIETAVVDSIDSYEARKAVGDLKETFVLSFGAAWIFKKSTLEDVFQGKLFNLHGARLPQNRGAGGFSWQIMMGNRFGFCLVHKVDEGIDTGDIVTYEEFIYPPSCRIPADFSSYYQDQNYIFIVSLLDSTRAQSKDFDCISQPEYLSTYWPRLHTPTHGWIDWKWSALEIERFICAFDDPYSGAQTLWRGKTVQIKKAFANYQDGYFHPSQAGLIYRINKNWLCIACKDGAIVIEQLIDESGDSLIPKVCCGDVLTTPVENLGQLGRRAVYTANSSSPKFGSSI